MVEWSVGVLGLQRGFLGFCEVFSRGLFVF